MMLQSSIPGRCARAVSAVFLLCILAASGCRDQVTPPAGQSARRTLTIVARERNPVTGECSVNAENAEITISRIDKDGETVIATPRTGDDGLAVYTAELPAAGMSISVRGVYKNQVQYSNPRIIVWCVDAVIPLCFDAVAPVDVECSRRIDTTIVIPFVNENGRTELIRGLPANVGKYQAAKTLFSVLSASEMCVTVDRMADGPFAIAQMVTTHDVTNERPAHVSTSELFTALFSVSTAQVGTFTSTFVFTAKSCVDTCQPKIFRVRLEAVVIDLPCDCPADSVVTLHPDIAVKQVGSTSVYTGLVLEEFGAECGPVVVDAITALDPNDGWRITAPAGPFPVQFADHRITFDAAFTPFHAGPSEDAFRFNIRFVNGKTCAMTVRLQGEACRDMCPWFAPNGDPPRPFAYVTPVDYRMTYSGGFIPFNNPTCASGTVIVQKAFTIMLPDSACCASPANIRISVQDDEPTKLASRFFSVSPSTNISVTKGGQSQILVKFTAPTFSEFDDIFRTNQRQRRGTVEDSTFTIRIVLANAECGSCMQIVNVTAIVGMSSQLSPIRNLRAYGQKTDLVRTPSTEVCTILARTNNVLDPGLVTALIDPAKNYPYPPNAGDFFVEVSDTSVAFPPLPLKEPMLFRVEGTDFDNILRVATAYPENGVVAINPIVDYVQNLVKANGNLFQQASLPYTFPPTVNSIRPRPGEVYAIFGDSRWNGAFGPIPCEIVLLYVRSRTVGQGEESANTHHQSGIEFRLVYPVVLY